QPARPQRRGLERGPLRLLLGPRALASAGHRGGLRGDRSLLPPRGQAPRGAALARDGVAQRAVTGWSAVETASPSTERARPAIVSRCLHDRAPHPVLVIPDHVLWIPHPLLVIRDHTRWIPHRILGIRDHMLSTQHRILVTRDHRDTR